MWRIFWVQDSHSIKCPEKVVNIDVGHKGINYIASELKVGEVPILTMKHFGMIDQRSISGNSCTDPVIINYNTIAYAIFVYIVRKLTLPWRKTSIVSIPARLEVH
jgi:hypothetical protein